MLHSPSVWLALYTFPQGGEEIQGDPSLQEGKQKGGSNCGQSQALQSRKTPTIPFCHYSELDMDKSCIEVDLGTTPTLT